MAGAFSTAFSSAFDTAITVGNSVSSSWNVRATVEDSMPTSWNVLSLTSAANSFSTSWDMDGRLIVSFNTAYLLPNTVYQTIIPTASAFMMLLMVLDDIELEAWPQAGNGLPQVLTLKAVVGYPYA